MNRIEAFRENVAMKFQLYNGLLMNMPFSEVQESGMLLPLFSAACADGLSRGLTPAEIVRDSVQTVGTVDTEKNIEQLFSLLRLIERQVVLFDSLEDAGFAGIHEMQGSGTLQDMINRIERKGRITDYKKFLESYAVRIVLTAHPTQFYTDEVLGILNDIAESVGANEIRNVHDYLLQLAQTRFKNAEKPSPLDEAKSLMWILENVMYSVIPKIHQKMIDALDIDTVDTLDYPGKLLLGFWPGGDRDGNPFVTADLTLQVADLLRSSILRLYLRDFLELRRRLTFGSLKSDMDLIQQRLEAATSCSNLDADAYKVPEEFLQDLQKIYRRVTEDHRGLFADKVSALVYKVQCFGFHFASLDVRQDSRVHERTLNCLLPKLRTGCDYSALGFSDRCKLLEELINEVNTAGRNQHYRNVLSETLASLRESDPVTADVVESIGAIQEIQKLNGAAGAHRYIISNTQSACHVLEVLLIGKLAGMGSSESPLHVVPLFETVDDLHNAESIMQGLYSMPAYRKHLEIHESTQTIMLGFSDGTKDGGYVTANWEIYRAKERLTDLAARQGVRVAFFDGRGGPPARGGGNTHKFYRSLGREIDSSSIQVTIQGQTISSMYGTEDAARYNLEQIFSAGIENNLFVTDYMQLSTSDRELLDELSKRAYTAYQKLRDTPLFVRYLELMTPLTYYGKTNIGSRPVKRGSASSLSLNDLRAIPFVGGWSQSKLNVPGYYGFGTALRELADEGRLSDLKNLCAGNLFFRAIVENSMQSLTKANFDLTAYHGKDQEFGEFWKDLRREAELTRELLIEISGQGNLLDTDPVIRASIGMREKMILPSLVIQQYALQMVRELREREGQEESIRKLEKLVVKALAIGVNASRNSV